jgi:hypothetical protein
MKIRVRGSTSLAIVVRLSHLTLNGRNIPLVQSVKYLGVIFEKKVTWGLHIKMIEGKASRTFIRVYEYIEWVIKC